jgi:hypothetical protein
MAQEKEVLRMDWSKEFLTGNRALALTLENWEDNADIRICTNI